MGVYCTFYISTELPPCSNNNGGETVPLPCVLSAFGLGASLLRVHVCFQELKTEPVFHNNILNKAHKASTAAIQQQQHTQV